MLKSRCQSVPIVVHARKKVLHRRNKSSKTKLYWPINISKFEELHGPLLGKNVTEICKMHFNKCRLRKSRYSSIQKWLAINFARTSKLGYKHLKQLIPLPSETTIVRTLKNFSQILEYTTQLQSF